MFKKKKVIKGKTFIVKGTAARIENGTIPRTKALALSHAITDLNSRNVESLLQAGKVYKITSNNRKKDYYIYRMSPNDRIVFSVEKGHSFIHDVIDLQTEKSILIPAESKK